VYGWAIATLKSYCRKQARSPRLGPGFIGLSPTLAFDELKSVISTVHLNTGNEVIFNYIAPATAFPLKPIGQGIRPAAA
jgi:hypothetical protein